jgi:two-component system phosphate regulon sensor histidine kinase PhoR
MFAKSNRALGFEKNTQFVERILFLSFPTALVFVCLAAFNLVDPVLAIISLAAVVLFNIALLFPLTFELQQIKHYVARLAKGELSSDDLLALSEDETRELVDVINNMHQFWAQKADVLEAQTLSDTAVLDSLPDPILVIDRNGNILGANLSARVSFGESITDKCVDQIFHSNNFVNAVSRVLNKETTSENLIFYVDKPIDQKLYAHIKQLPWISKGKAVAVISIYDLTKSLKIEKMQSDFVANASHELRTPLSVISGFVETLQTTAKDDPKAQQDFLKIIADQTEYMTNLVENLLSLSRIELNQNNLPEDAVDLEKIVDDVTKSLELKAEAREMKLHVIKEPNLPAVRADAQQIKQVVQNLTDNAIKYGLFGTEVTLRLFESDKIPASKSSKTSNRAAVVVSVNNKGPKIASEKLARLTERFYRLQEHKDQNIKGTGLGLAIAKHIVIRHQGNITVNSNGYNGTTFSVYLPVFEPEDERASSL